VIYLQIYISVNWRVVGIYSDIIVCHGRLDSRTGSTVMSFIVTMPVVLIHGVGSFLRSL
jgi:hypothetical protein